MIVVTLKGGLGNQLFQYAAAKSLALKHGVEVCIDKSFLNADPQGRWTQRRYELDAFPALNSLKEYSLLNRVAGKLSPRKRFTESGLTFDKAFENCGDDVILDGYFQTEKYFLAHAAAIRNDFSFSEHLSDANRNYVNAIHSAPVSISVHIRRGDMITLKSANEYHGTLQEDYYAAAFERMKLLHGEDLSFFIFSDDHSWVKANVAPPGKVVYVDSNAGNGAADMHLMSLCKHHITANSSFSWWGAWLNNSREKVVIAPKNWFRDSGPDTSDLVPDHWIRI